MWEWVSPNHGRGVKENGGRRRSQGSSCDAVLPPKISTSMCDKKKERTHNKTSHSTAATPKVCELPTGDLLGLLWQSSAELLVPGYEVLAELAAQQQKKVTWCFGDCTLLNLPPSRPVGANKVDHREVEVHGHAHAHMLT